MIHLKLAELDQSRADEVQRELERQWDLLRTDKNHRARVAQLGINLSELDAVETYPIVAEPKGGNRADIATAIIIGIAVKIGSDIGQKALKALWQKVIRPQIAKQFGKLDESAAPDAGQ